MIAYVDSSVLLRVVFGEANSLREWKKVTRAVSSQLIVTETLRTLDRVRIRSSLTDSTLAERRSVVLSMISSLELVELDRLVLERAAQPMPTSLGTLDAIHLASAILWREHSGLPITMATHDVELATAAWAHGFPVIGVPLS